MAKQPFYRLQFKATACYFEIYVNDMPLFSTEVNHRISTTLPINYLILERGLQQLSVKIRPASGETFLHEEADFSMKVQLYDVEHSMQHIEDILEYQIPSEADKTSRPIIEYKTSFDATVPYQIAAWQNSADLRNIPNLKELVDDVYKKITNYIHTKQYGKFVEMLFDKNNNRATSLYLSSKEIEKTNQELIDDFESGFKILPFSSDYKILYYAHGKVIQLVTTDSEPVFRFFNEETEEEMTLDFMFHLKQGNTELTVL